MSLKLSQFCFEAIQLQCIYRARDIHDANIVKARLEQMGHAIELRGDQLWTLRGELPFTADTLPSLWVTEEEKDRAAKDLKQILRKIEVVEPEWKCSHCGELVEGNFGNCWNCNTDKP